MKKTFFAIGMLMLSSPAFSAQAAHWGYSGHTGPAHWATLTPEYGACAGKNQSPVNLTSFIQADMKPIAFRYISNGKEILNNGHAVQINVHPGSSIQVDGREFELKQFHFHAPSENHIRGRSFPMEAHLVHADKDGNLAVVAVMFTEGRANAALRKAWAQMPKHAGDKSMLASTISPTGILPANRDHYRFNGSLTTPPCTEGVRWLVMKQPVSASKAQIARFAEVMQHPNNRPVQAINARTILE